MAKSVEDLTLDELQAIVKKRERMAKKAPALRKERAKLEKRLAEIDKQLTQLGPDASKAPKKRRGRKPGPKPGSKRKATAKKTAPKKRGRPGRKPKAATTAPAAAPVVKTGKRLPRGAVRDAILKVMGRKTLSPAQIAEAVGKDIIPGIAPKSIQVAVDKLYRQGRLLRVGYGKYKAAPAKQ